MYLRTINKSSLIQTAVNTHFCCRSFHLSCNNFLRRVISKQSEDNSESEFHKENIKPCQIVQKSYSNFLGIESDEGVTLIEPNENSKSDLLKSMEMTDIKKIHKEKYYRTSFGVVRQDSDNKLNFHGQFENKIYSMFPHKSSNDSEVSNEFHNLKKDVLNILYKDKINNSKSETHFSESNFPDEPLADNFNLYTASSIDENEKQTYNPKETQDMSYIDQCFFGSLEDKDISSENFVYNKGPVEELNYLDKAFVRHEVPTENPISHNESEMSSFKNSVSDAFHETKLEEMPQENVSHVESLNYLDEMFFGPPQNCISHSEMNNLQNNLAIDELYLNENKSLNLLLGDKGEDTSTVNDVRQFTHKEKLNSLNSSNIHDSSKTKCDENNIHTSKAPIQKEFKINILNKSNNSQFDNFQKSKIDKLPNQPNKITSKHNVENENVFNDKQFSQLNDKIYSNLDVQSIKAKSDFSFDKNSRYVENTKFFAETNSKRVADESKQISTAQEFVQNIRRESEIKSVEKGTSTLSGEKLDSKGFRVLKNQTPNLSYCTHDEIITMLKDSILYSDENLLVLNKPYSLVIHDSQTTKVPCLSELLEELAKATDKTRTDPKLYTLHRLDKETTGCLLLANILHDAPNEVVNALNETTAEMIKSLFSQRKIIKKYLILTTRIPDPLQGIIDIPVAEGSIGDRKRMVLQPQLPKDMAYRNHCKGGKRAVTHYKVLSVSGSAALVEATPETGIKHQIRVHFGFGLSCPILGDHKYSHFDKLAPQKLPSDLLQKLHVRQSKVRHIPMHLHAQSITIPGYLDGRNLYVTAPLPDHMIKNLKRLKFKKRNKLIL